MLVRETQRTSYRCVCVLTLFTQILPRDTAIKTVQIAHLVHRACRRQHQLVARPVRDRPAGVPRRHDPPLMTAIRRQVKAGQGEAGSHRRADDNDGSQPFEHDDADLRSPSLWLVHKESYQPKKGDDSRPDDRSLRCSRRRLCLSHPTSHCETVIQTAHEPPFQTRGLDRTDAKLVLHSGVR